MTADCPVATAAGPGSTARREPDRSIRLLRCLDGALYSLLLAACLAVAGHLTPGAWAFETPLFLVPVTGIALAGFCLPVNRVTPAFTGNALKIAALAFAGLAPFVFWWLRTPHSPYLAFAGNLALLAGSCFLTQLAGALRLLFVRCAAPPPVLFAAWVVKELFFYAVVLPTLVINGLLLYAWLGVPRFDLTDFPRLWLVLPAGFRCVMLLPFAGLVIALLFCRHLIASGTGGGVRAGSGAGPGVSCKEADR